MAIMNLLTGSWSGKVGQTVGSKWKNKNTIRTYAIPTYTDTPAQVHVRTFFRDMSKFLALFTAELKTLSSLNTTGMSVRNAIIKANKGLFAGDDFDPADLIINKGSLPNLSGYTVTAPSGLADLEATWTPSVSPIVSANAKAVVVIVSAENDFAVVATALQTAGTLSIRTPVPASADLHAYLYLMDKRASAKVGGQSVYSTVTAPAA